MITRQRKPKNFWPNEGLVIPYNRSCDPLKKIESLTLSFSSSRSFRSLSLSYRQRRRDIFSKNCSNVVGISGRNGGFYTLVVLHTLCACLQGGFQPLLCTLEVASFGDETYQPSPRDLRRHDDCHHLLSIGKHTPAHTGLHHCWNSDPESLRTYTLNDTSLSRSDMLSQCCS